MREAEKITSLEVTNKFIMERIGEIQQEVSSIRTDIKNNNKEIADRLDKTTEKLDRNFEKFTEGLAATYATKSELDTVAEKVNSIDSFTNKVLWGLITSLITIVIGLVCFIYLNGIK